MEKAELVSQTESPLTQDRGRGTVGGGGGSGGRTRMLRLRSACPGGDGGGGQRVEGGGGPALSPPATQSSCGTCEQEKHMPNSGVAFARLTQHSRGASSLT